MNPDILYPKEFIRSHLKKDEYDILKLLHFYV